MLCNSSIAYIDLMPPVAYDLVVTLNIFSKIEMLFKQIRQLTFTFSHLEDTFIQSDVQRREQSSYEQ